MYSKIKTSRVFNRAAAPFSGLMASSAWAQAPVIVSLPPLKALLLLGAMALVPFAAVDYLLRQHVVSLVMSLDLWGYLREDIPIAPCLFGWIITVLGYQLLVFPRAAAGAKYPTLEGAAYGVLMYGMRDMTQQAIIYGWTWTLTGLDVLCGAVACTVLAAVHNRLFEALTGGSSAASGSKALPQ